MPNSYFQITPDLTSLAAYGALSPAIENAFVAAVDGNYIWNPTSTAIADGYNIVSATGISTGRWVRQVKARQAPPAPPVTRNEIMSIISGCPVEKTPNSVSGCTFAINSTNAYIGDRAINLVSSGGANDSIIYTPLLFNNITPSVIGPASALGLHLYVADASKFSSFEVDLWTDAGLSSGKSWGRSASQSANPIVNGWNHLVWPAADGIGDFSSWGNIYQLRFLFTTTSPIAITIGQLYAVTPAKAKIIFQIDGPQQTFIDGAYPQFKNRNIPLTMNVVCAQLGIAPTASVATVNSLLAENNNAVSLHSYNGENLNVATNPSITSDQTLAYTMLGLGFFKAQGWFSSWKGAWQDNIATFSSAVKHLFMAMATSSAAAGNDIFPPKNRFDMPRVGLHGMSNSDIDALFAKIEAFRPTIYMYTHGYNTGDSHDVSAATFAYFLTKYDAAVAAGQIEAVTFEQMAERYGWKWQIDYTGKEIMSLGRDAVLDSTPYGQYWSGDQHVTGLIEGSGHVTQKSANTVAKGFAVGGGLDDGFMFPPSKSLNITFKNYFLRGILTDSTGHASEFIATYGGTAITITGDTGSFTNGSPSSGQLGLTKIANSSVIVIASGSGYSANVTYITSLSGPISLTNPA